MRWPAGWTGSIAAAAAALTAMGALAQATLPTQGRPSAADQRARLIQAKADAAAAATRAEALARQAASERNAAARARAEEAAAAARVRRAEADLEAGRARVALVQRLLDDQRARLAHREAPAARLLGALTSLARRPALASIAQPGSIDDLVHVRAVLGATLPVVRARTAGMRAELGRTRALEADTALAAATLDASRARLEQQRQDLAALEARHRGRATALGRAGLTESDRALALGERARDIVDQIEASGDERAIRAELETLPGPGEPGGGGVAPATSPAYRVPVAGTLATGFGELAAAGFRARGITLAVAPRAAIVAPAGGRVRYARGFRNEGLIIIIDHGAGWTSLLTGFGALAVREGARVTPGAPLGTARSSEAPRVTVELRRHGRPVDVAALL